MSAAADAALLRQNIARLDAFMNGGAGGAVVLRDHTITTLLGLIGSAASDTAPPVTWPGRHWVDTSIPGAPVFKLRDADDAAWIEIPVEGLASLVADVAGHETRLDAAESDIGALEAADTAFDLRVDALEAADTALEARVDTLEATDPNTFNRKAPVAVATTANITLSGEQTIDGVLTSASRVLVRSQTAPAENGVYVSAAGAWSRATDMDAAGEVYGATVFVNGGTVNGGKRFFTASTVATLGTDSIVWQEDEDNSALQDQIDTAQADLDALEARTSLTYAWVTGDRSADIAASSSDLFSGKAANLVDGSKTADANDAVRFSSTMSGKSIVFDFGYSSRLLLAAIRFWWNGQRSQGFIKLQVSADAVAWTDVSGSINWGAALTLSGSDYYEEHDLTPQFAAGGPTGYRYARILGVSGSYTAIEWLTEVEFKTAESRIHASIDNMAPDGGATGYALMKASAGEANVHWADPRDDLGPRRFMADVERLLAYERGSEARFHADSVYGLDANDGVSSARAKKTIAGLLAMTITKGSAIGLRAGSTFTDKTIEPATGFKKLVGIGEGDLPLLDCAPALSAGDFTSSAAGAQTYEIMLTRETGVTYVNDPQYQMWEVSADGTTRKELLPVASSAAVQATAGTVYFVDRQSASSLAYVHPFGSTDPRSDGKTYKASKLKAGAGVNGDSGATTNPAYDGQYIEGIHASGQVDGHGSILSGDDTTMKRCLASFGNKHNIIFKSGFAEDSIAYGWGKNPVNGQIAWTVFRYDAEGRKARLNRCMAIAAEHEPGGSAFYCHGSTSPDGLDLDEVVLDQFVSVDCGSTTASAITQKYADSLFYSRPGSVTPIAGIDIRADQPTCEIDRLIFWALREGNGAVRRPNPPGSSPSTANRAHVRNSVVNELPGGNTISNGLVNVKQDTTFNLEKNLAILRTRLFFNASGMAFGAGSTVHDNIVVVNKPTGALAAMNYPADANLDIDYNVYVHLHFGTWNLQITAAGTTYNILSQANFATYKSGSGQDANSILIGPEDAETLFAAGVAGMLAGDLRLNPNCPLKFTDGTLVVERAGIREHLDWNRRVIVPGAPSRIPVPPVTLAEAEAYCRAPALWDWYAA